MKRQMPRSQYVKALRTLYQYDRNSGHLIDRTSSTVVGSPNQTGTMRCTFLGEQTTVARLVWIYHYGKAPVGKVLNIHAHKSDKSKYMEMVKGKPAISTKIEELYDSGTNTFGAHASNPEQPSPDDIAKATTVDDIGITWQKSHKSFKVVVRGRYVGSRKTLEDARKLKDSYILAKEHKTTRWFGETDAPTPSRLKEELHTDRFEYNGKEYRKHSGWNKYIYGMGDNEVRGTEDQIKRYIDALNSGDVSAVWEVVQELASGV